MQLLMLARSPRCTFVPPTTLLDPHDCAALIASLLVSAESACVHTTEASGPVEPTEHLGEPTETPYNVHHTRMRSWTQPDEPWAQREHRRELESLRRGEERG